MKHSVLLVDDESDYVQAMAERLTLRGFTPVYATDGEEGLKIANKIKPNLMVLDLRMPGLDGIEVLRRIRTDHPKMQVVVLTGHGTEADRTACMELGAVAFYNKPMNIEVLAQTLRDAAESA